jgi:8-oxo-(d)GTP phosphatase
MNLFINDTFIKIIQNEVYTSVVAFDSIFEANKCSQISWNTLFGTVAIENATITEIKQIIFTLEKLQNPQIKKIVITVLDKEKVKENFKNQFKIVIAAGGIVTYKNNYLMMFRRKKWDLPKGKMDSGETPRQTALREIQEECNIRCRIIDKIDITYHNYKQGNEVVFKKTHWFWLTTSEPEKIKPQYEEDIEELLWANAEQRHKALQNSFGSIKYVIEYFDNQLFM